jgi:hypothetical protein
MRFTIGMGKTPARWGRANLGILVAASKSDPRGRVNDETAAALRIVVADRGKNAHMAGRNRRFPAAIDRPERGP